MPEILRSPGNGLAVPSRIDSVVALLYMSPRKSQIKAHHELCMRMWANRLCDLGQVTQLL